MPDAVVKAMAGRSSVHVAARGQDKHLHYSQGVTVEEMRQASMALMELIPIEPSEVQKVGTSVGTDQVGTWNRIRNDLQRPRLTSERPEMSSPRCCRTRPRAPRRPVQGWRATQYAGTSATSAVSLGAE